MRAVSDLDLERLLVDDLQGDERARVQAAVDDDAELAAYVAARRAEQAAYWRRAPRLVPVAAPRAGLVARALRALSSSLTGPALVASAACLAVFIAVDGAGGDGGGALRARGGALAVSAVVKRAGDGAQFRLAQQPLRAGDALRLTLDVAHRGRRAVVVNVDARGAVAVVLEDVVGDDGVVGGSVVLDASEGTEQLVVALTDAPAQRVAQEVRRGHDRGLTAALSGALGGAPVGVVVLAKESAP